MKIASTKITDEEYQAFNNWCQSKNTTINGTLGNVIREILEGKVKPKPTGLESRILFCPDCGFVLFPNYADRTFDCLRCGFYARVPGPGRWHQGEINLDLEV